MKKIKEIFEEIALERQKQNKKWGIQNHDRYKYLAILGEEFGEAYEAAFEGDREQYRKELIHTVAVGVLMIESLDRGYFEVKGDMILRHLLWMKHGCGFGSLYADDGEMQCNKCMIDFKRDSIEKIKNIFQKQTNDAIKEYNNKNLRSSDQSEQ